VLEQIAAEALLGEFLPQAGQLDLALGLGLVEGGLFGLGDLQLGGDGGMDRGHLGFGALAGVAFLEQFVFEPLQLLDPLAKLGFALLAPLALVLQVLLQAGGFGVGLVQQLVGALGEFGGELAGQRFDRQIGGLRDVHGGGRRERRSSGTAANDAVLPLTLVDDRDNGATPGQEPMPLPPPPAEPTTESRSDPARRILITGASSGIGLEAAVQLHQAGHRLILTCRDASSAAALGVRLPGISAVVCDLADLESVAAAAAELQAAEQPVDSLLLNAGLQYSGAPEPLWSAQGHEQTIAVNHLGHQALLQRVLPLLLRGTAPRLVVTASEVHDPATPGGRVGRAAGLGDLEGLRSGPGAAMVDGGGFDAEKAYKDSKLCNLLMARALAERLRPIGNPVAVRAWSPGLVIPRDQGGFFRYSRRHNPIGQALFALLARDLLRFSETPQRAGALLAQLALGDPEVGGSDVQAQGGGTAGGSVDAADEIAAAITAEDAVDFAYWSNRLVGPGRLRFERRQPSAEASDRAKAQELWDLSAGWIGLPTEVG
jgi:protochlorophyllide reductase